MNLEVPDKVPYEDGNHCIFYAVQDASIYFNQKPLKVEDRDKIGRQKDRAPSIYLSITGLKEEKGGWFKLSMGILMENLRENGIVPDKIWCIQDAKEVLENLNFIKRENICVKAVSGSVEIEYPSILVIQAGKNREGNHVWFCKSQEDYEKDYNGHVCKGDNIILAAHLKKMEQQ